MDTDTFVAYDDLENAIFQIFMDNAPSGYDTGDLTIGDFVGNNGIMWDSSEGKMTLRGILSADDITTGSLSVSYLNSGTIAGASIILNPYSYMESSNFIYETSGWRLGGNGTIDAVLDRIQLEEVSSAGPGAVANCGWIYTRDEGAITELFYKDSQGKEIQLTKDGVPDIMLGFRSGDLLLTSNTTVPSGWTDVSSTYDNRFIRISSGTALVTAGSDTHDHAAGTYSVSSHVHGLSGGGNTGTESGTLTAQIGDGDSTTFPGLNHTHPMGSGSTQGATAGITGTSATGNNVPAYVQVKVYKRN
jgi:hypothetical protein